MKLDSPTVLRDGQQHIRHPMGYILTHRVAYKEQRKHNTNGRENQQHKAIATVRYEIVHHPCGPVRQELKQHGGQRAHHPHHKAHEYHMPPRPQP